MTGTESISETLVCFNHLRRPSAPEDFIEFSHRESFKARTVLALEGYFFPPIPTNSRLSLVPAVNITDRLPVTDKMCGVKSAQFHDVITSRLGTTWNSPRNCAHFTVLSISRRLSQYCWELASYHEINYSPELGRGALNQITVSAFHPVLMQQHLWFLIHLGL